jgi:MOSC domain-containing protein YiiM
MRLLSIQVGLPKEVEWDGKRVSTGIYKYPVSGPVEVKKLNLEGDGQADLTVHGGADKAVYAYSLDAYPWWRETLQSSDLPNGAFGENLTFDAFDERSIGIGDKFALGGCELQAVQPRFPCFKLGIKFGDMEILRTFLSSGRPGIYFRVLKEGKIREGDTLRCLWRDPERVSVWDFFDLKIRKYADKALLARLLRIRDLNTEWRGKFQEQLAKLS